MELLASNVMRSCVGLLLECVDYLCSHQPEAEESGGGGDRVKSKLDVAGGTEEEGGVFWRTLKAGLTASSWTVRYKTIEKLTSILQFMLSSEVVKLEHQSFHNTLKTSLARSFCLLTQLLQDRNSSVCTRVRYCITSIKESALEAIRHFLTTLFRECPAHRVLVMQTLSLLDSALPELHFLNLDLLNKLLGVVIHGSAFPFMSGDRDQASKKVSDSSLTSSVPLLRGVTPKISTASASSVQFDGGEVTNDPVVVGLTQQLLSLLLRHIGNPRANVKESMKNAHHSVQQQATKRNMTIKKSIASGTSEEMFVSILQRDFFGNVSNPFDLRTSSVFEVFLDHIYFVLDHNIEFGHTKGLLPFVLRLLASSAAPTVDDYRRFEVEERQSGVGSGPSYGLGCLPLHMQVPWLKVLFVILYKYIHDYSEVTDSGTQHLVHSLAFWCFKVTLNTFECLPHDCPMLQSLNKQPQKPALRRQTTIESFGSDDLSPLEEPSGKLQGVARDVLTPVPEDVESANAVKVERGGDSRAQHVSFVPSPALRSVGLPSSLASGGGGGPGRNREEGGEMVNSDLPQAGRCVTCGAPSNEFGEEVMALCAVVIGTFSNRLPHVVPRYLVSRIIPAMTKVITPGYYTWQKFNDSNSLVPGSAAAVAKHMLSSVLTQFGERRLFVYLFSYNYGDMVESVFAGIASSLGEVEGETPSDQAGGDKEGCAMLYQSSPVRYLFEDATSSLHFNQDFSKYSFINLATYLRALESSRSQAAAPSAPPILLTRDLVLWEAFLRKLKGHSEVLRDRKSVTALLEVLVTLFQYTIDYQVPQYSLSLYRANQVQSLIQSLLSIMETALHNVCCPLGGVVMLCGLWYKVFQQQSQRDAEKLIKLIISELRKALKLRLSFGDAVLPENFLSLIQVLLLEENGYLGYVKGLSHMKISAVQLKQEYETHCLNVLQSSQWEFSDTLYFLSTPSLYWPYEMVPQLKLSVAQLVALRVQHGRAPAEKLRKMIAGDNKIILSSNSKSATGFGTWQSSFDSLHVLSWLLLGAMSHNAIHSVAMEMRTLTSSGGQCLILQCLSSKMEEVVQRSIFLTRNVLSKINANNEAESKFDYIEMTFLFGVILTVYLELYVPTASTPLILEYWEKVAGCLAHQLSTRVERSHPQLLSSAVAYCTEVIHSLNEQVVTRIREIDLSCYTLILPVLQEVADKSIPNKKQDFLGGGSVRQSSYTPVNMWFDEALAELFRIEMESIPNNPFK